jgi:hypothetical protein
MPKLRPDRGFIGLAENPPFSYKLGMPRPLRHVVVTAASFTSLAVCVATLGLWFHSTQRLERLRSGTEMRRVTLHCKDGEVFIDMAETSAPIWRSGFQHIHALPTQFRPPRPAWEIGGLGAGSETVTDARGVVRRKFVQIPLWPVVVLSSILPVMWFDSRGRKTPGLQTAAEGPAFQPPLMPHPIFGRFRNCRAGGLKVLRKNAT